MRRELNDARSAVRRYVGCVLTIAETLEPEESRLKARGLLGSTKPIQLSSCDCLLPLTGDASDTLAKQLGPGPSMWRSRGTGWRRKTAEDERDILAESI